MDLRIADVALTDAEIDAGVAALRSGFLAQGPRVEELEARWAEAAGVRFAVAVSSGTAAIHCALAALGIGPGDEVVTVPFTFIGTVNPVLMLGASVSFVDIRRDDFTIDVDRLLEAISPRTKAVIAVDLFGQPYDATPLRELCAARGIAVVEDACQAIGARYRDLPAGSLGDAACFSLYATKNITCGEGGVVTTDRPDVADAARLFRQHGMRGPYEYVSLGYNYRLTEVAAAIASVQLTRLADLNGKRQSNAAALSSQLREVPGLECPVIHPDRTHVFHQYTVRVNEAAKVDRDSLLASLHAAGVRAAVYYPQGLHRVSHIAKMARNSGLPVTDKACAEVLSLPVHPRLSVSDIEFVADAVRNALTS